MIQTKKLLTVVLSTVALTTATATFAQKQNELNKPSFKAGQKFTTKNTVTTLSKMEMMGQEMEIKADVALARQFDIKEKKGNMYAVASTITKMVSKAEMMGQNLNYDSENKADTSSEMAKMFKDKLNVPVELEMNDEGKIVPLKKDTSKAAADGNGMAAMMQGMGAGGDETAITDDLFISLPKKLKTGDKWNDSTIVEGVKTYRNYTVKSMQGNDAVVTITGNQMMDKKMETNGMEMTLAMENKLSGEMNLDAASGVIKQRTLTVEGSGNINMMGQEVPMTTKVETVSTTTAL